jgi:hypothetical protein
MCAWVMKKVTLNFDPDLRENSAKGMETQVKMGERIGKLKYVTEVATGVPSKS